MEYTNEKLGKKALQDWSWNGAFSVLWNGILGGTRSICTYCWSVSTSGSHWFRTWRGMIHIARHRVFQTTVTLCCVGGLIVDVLHPKYALILMISGTLLWIWEK